MDDYLDGVRLILIVLSLLLRLNGFVLIYMKRKRVWVVPPAVLNLFSPVLNLVLLSYVTSKGWRGIGKGRTFGDTFLFIILLIASQLFAGIIFVWFLFLLHFRLPSGRAIGPAADPMGFLPVYLFAIISLSALLLLCMLRMVVPKTHPSNFLKGKKVLETTALTYLLMVPLQLFIWGYGWLLGDAGFESSSSSFMQMDGSLELLAVLVPVVLVAPFIEEMFFRGYLFKLLEDKLGANPAVLLTAVLFAAAHFNPYTFLPILLMGAVMGWSRKRSGSIVPSLVLHVTNNLIAVLLVYLSS
jgi:membrane protease YdiL (CAAX protease family)